MLEYDLTILAAGAVVGKDKLAGCAMILTGVTKKGVRLYRALSFPLGNTTLNLAAIRAAQLGLMTIKEECQPKSKVDLYLDNRYVIEMLEKQPGSGFVRTPKNNVEAVLGLRELAWRFEEFNPNYLKFDEDGPAECLALAKATAENQASSDTGTRDISG